MCARRPWGSESPVAPTPTTVSSLTPGASEAAGAPVHPRSAGGTVLTGEWIRGRGDSTRSGAKGDAKSLERQGRTS